MIYVLRHQESDPLTNVLTVRGLLKTKQMATTLERHFQNVPMKGIHTCQSNGYGHVRPLQTASNLCTFLRGNYSTFAHDSIESVVRDLSKMTDITGYDIVIVWHHSELSELIRSLCERFCIPYDSTPWPNRCFDGVQIIDVFSKTSTFYKDFFKKKYFFISQLFHCIW